MFNQPKLVSVLALAGIALFGALAAQAQIVKIDGSSTVYPITEAVAEEFQKAKKNAVKVTVGISTGDWGLGIGDWGRDHC